MHLKKVIPLIISSYFLTACGGSSDSDTAAEITPPDTTPPADILYSHQVKGLAVYQGALAGANVCVDLNKNLACDDDEPTTTTDNDGNYQIDWNSAVETPEYYLMANWTTAASNARQPAKALSLNFKNPLAVTNTLGVIGADGVGQLTALSKNNGAINSLTSIQLNRTIEINNSDLPTQDATALLSELDVLLSRVYQLNIDELYQVDAANSVSDNFLISDALYLYVDQVVAGQVPSLLAVEKILGISFEDLKDMLNDSDFTIEEFIKENPIAARIIISNAAIALGFTENPLDREIMSQSDWDIVFNNIENELGFKNTYILSSSVGFTSFSLQDDSIKKMLTGFIVNDIVSAFEIDMSFVEDNLDDDMACWNSEAQGWITKIYEDSELENPEPFVNGNTYTTYYEGTTIPIEFHVEKFWADETDWQAIIERTPTALKLNSLTWPESLFKIQIAQKDDVICRQPDVSSSLTYDLPNSDSPQLITTTDIVSTFFSSDYPEYTNIDSEAQAFTIKDYDGEITAVYTWELLTSPSDQPMIEITSVNVDPSAPSLMNSDYYILEYIEDENVAVEVELYKATPLDAITAPLMVTYDDDTFEFTTPLYQHLLGLTVQPQ
ncbi:hypothetical protein [Shewanella donghaensis]|uniref:hypothetical protein n=1 Tax=Shewanella donghaensis TaxID=238836 RepID=UPI0011838C3B|nr:hypothetical protein [Shewanella donghaensis]